MIANVSDFIDRIIFFLDFYEYKRRGLIVFTVHTGNLTGLAGLVYQIFINAFFGELCENFSNIYFEVVFLVKLMREVEHVMFYQNSS